MKRCRDTTGGDNPPDGCEEIRKGKQRTAKQERDSALSIMRNPVPVIKYYITAVLCLTALRAAYCTHTPLAFT